MKVIFCFILFCISSGIVCNSVEDNHMNNFVKEEVMKILRDETKQYFERQDRHIHELETFQEKQRLQIRKMEKDRLEQLLLVAELKSYQEIQNNNIHELQVKLQIQTETLKEITKICEHDKNQNKYSINHRNGYMHRQKENYTNENKPLNLGSQENITANLHKWSLQKNMENDSTTEVAHDVKRTDKLHLDIGQDVMVAFYAYMSASEPSPGQHHTFIFDSIMTNSGSGYNKHNGMFTVPNHGHYVFTWIVISARHGWVYSEIVINSSPLGSILTDSDDTNEEHIVTGTIVVEANQGDVVYIRTNPKIAIRGGIPSSLLRRTSFSGWKIF